jgi:hypothetical protein
MKSRRRRWLKRVGLALLALAVLAAGALTIEGYRIMAMPGQSHAGALPQMTAPQRALAARLRRRVELLAGDIGERSADRPENYRAAEESIAAGFVEAKLAPARLQCWRRDSALEVCNLEASVPGSVRPDQIVVIGAHYDTVRGSPGANDNASGVAALLEIARSLAGAKTGRTLRFVAFYNEELGQGAEHGSRLYAAACRRRGDDIVAMICLETIGYYTDAPDTQHYPFPLSAFYPSTGNFIGFVGNSASRALVRSAVGSFRKHAVFPSRGAALPGAFEDASRSDHSAFWAQGYPAIMVTDTANFRYPHYHQPTDTPDKLDYDRLARVTEGLERVVEDLAEVKR